MSDQRSDKKVIPDNMCFFYFRLELEPEILNCQILCAVLYCVLRIILYLPDSNK